MVFLHMEIVTPDDASCLVMEAKSSRSTCNLRYTVCAVKYIKEMKHAYSLAPEKRFPR
jgi:hypothetical protein